MTCGLAEEETRLVSSRGPYARHARRGTGSIFVISELSKKQAPDQVPPADRLRADLSVGTNRASCNGVIDATTHNHRA